MFGCHEKATSKYLDILAHALEFHLFRFSVGSVSLYWSDHWLCLARIRMCRQKLFCVAFSHHWYTTLYFNRRKCFNAIVCSLLIAKTISALIEFQFISTRCYSSFILTLSPFRQRRCLQQQENRRKYLPLFTISSLVFARFYGRVKKSQSSLNSNHKLANPRRRRKLVSQLATVSKSIGIENASKLGYCSDAERTRCV